MYYDGKININLHHCSISFKLNDTAKCYNRGDENKNKHYNLWKTTLKYFSSRGFIVGKDPDIEKNYTCLSKDHAYGIKNGLEFVSRRYPTGFIFEFFQNETKPENSNGGRFDFDKYNKMPYRLKLTLKNECNRLANYCEELGIIINFNSEPKFAIEKIIKDNNTNPHIHGKIKDVSELKYKIGVHNSQYNSSDKNKKQIICGETKWFYCNYSRRLLKGIAYHNINNMWWVILNDTSLRNIVSSDLFDYVEGMPFKLSYSKERQLNKLNEKLTEYSKSQNYERCIKIREVIKKLINQPVYKVYSNKHSCWWRSGNCGYTSDESKAGLYLEENILSHNDYYNNGKDTIAIKQ